MMLHWTSGLDVMCGWSMHLSERERKRGRERRTDRDDCVYCNQIIRCTVESIVLWIMVTRCLYTCLI